MTDEDRGRLTEDDLEATTQRSAYLRTRGWYIEEDLWQHENLPTVTGVDAIKAMSIQSGWDASV